MSVIGISRQPEKLGKHERYTPRPVDIDEVSVEELAKKFEGIDVLVSEYEPHTAGGGALLYSKFAPLFPSHSWVRQRAQNRKKERIHNRKQCHSSKQSAS
jgi:hypothetical protein